jgi:hypothetical protein
MVVDRFNNHVHHEVGDRLCLARSCNAFRFDRIRAVAQAGCVNQCDPQAVQIDHLRHQITRCPCEVGDDRARGTRERIE